MDTQLLEVPKVCAKFFPRRLPKIELNHQEAGSQIEIKLVVHVRWRLGERDSQEGFLALGPHSNLVQEIELAGIGTLALQ